jgi:toxin-antitoxin system PIN domain toxin
MNSLNFLDTNVWLALVWERHSGADAAQSWFASCGDEQFFFCRFTQIAVLRLLTNKIVMGRDVQSMAGAWGIYDRCCVDDRIALLAEPEGLDPRFRGFTKNRLPSPNVWADAYLAAFAATAGLRLITFDKALAGKSPGSLLLS